MTWRESEFTVKIARPLRDRRPGRTGPVIPPMIESSKNSLISHTYVVYHFEVGSMFEGIL